MKISNKIKSILKKLPKSPGVYFYYDKNGKIIYIGKASILAHRVRSYFLGAHDNKTEELVSHITNIKYRVTSSVIEALVLESNLIKKYQPKYNIRERDDKSFIQIALTADEFPRLLKIRPTEFNKTNQRNNEKIKKLFGPYTNAGAVKEIMNILRKLFTYRDCSNFKFARYKKLGKPCIYYNIGLCPAPCTGQIAKKDYQKIIKQISNFLDGKTKRAISALTKKMKYLAKNNQYEQAAKIRDRIFAYRHINDVALIKEERSLEQLKNIPHRIECYDISNLGQNYTVGSMVVFTDGEIDNSQYRKFRIRSHESARNLLENRTKNNLIINNKKLIANSEKLKANYGDAQAMAQVIDRRFNHHEWQTPDLLILDGGKGQLSAVLNMLRTKKIKLPVMAIAKGPTRKGFALFKNNLAKNIILNRKFIQRVRDEAHRFAITYHRELREKINSSN